MYVDQLASATLVGTALSSNTASAGGGVYAAAQAHVTLTGVSLRHNTASNYGGGVHTTDMASVVATTPSFVGNTAARSGGGINLDAASTVTVTGGSATSNVVTMGHGGFVAVNVAAPGVGVRAALHAVFVSQNTAQSGGGVAVFGSYVPPPSPAEAECLPSGSAAAPFASATTGLTMKATTVTSNTASGGSGGGILVTGTGTELVATDCTVQQHQVTQAGAGIVVQRGGVLRAQRLSCLDNVANSGGCLHASAGMCGLTKPWRVARCPHHTLTPAAAVAAVACACAWQMRWWSGSRGRWVATWQSWAAVWSSPAPRCCCKAWTCTTTALPSRVAHSPCSRAEASLSATRLCDATMHR